MTLPDTAPWLAQGAAASHSGVSSLEPRKGLLAGSGTASEGPPCSSFWSLIWPSPRALGQAWAPPKPRSGPRGLDSARRLRHPGPELLHMTGSGTEPGTRRLSVLLEDSYCGKKEQRHARKAPLRGGQR